jgi:hypothetical protein
MIDAILDSFKLEMAAEIMIGTIVKPDCVLEGVKDRLFETGIE